MGIQLFGILAILGAGIIPVNFLAQPGDNKPQEGLFEDESILLRRLSVENIPQGSNLLQIHLLYLWICSFITYGFLIVFYRDYVNLKFMYLEYILKKSKLSKVEMRSIMVYGIPRDLRHEADLKAYFDNLGIGKVLKIVDFKFIPFRLKVL